MASTIRQLAKSIWFDSARLQRLSHRLVFFVTGRLRASFSSLYKDGASQQQKFLDGRHSWITQFYWRKGTAVLD
jgi:hypothetical protein